MIKTITFDFGGVLYDYDGAELMEKLAANSSKTAGDFEDLLAGSSLDRAHFRGEVNAGELLDTLRDRVGLDMTIDDLADAYCKSVKPREEVFHLVRALESGYDLQLYSDTPELLYERVIKEMPVFDAFSEVVLSFRVGKLKDEPEGHREVIAKSGNRPEEIVFIDDREEFVEKSRELGINGIQFTNLRDLVGELGGLGVKLDGKLDFNWRKNNG